MLETVLILAAEAIKEWLCVHGMDIALGIVSVLASVVVTFVVMVSLVKGLGWLVRRLGWGS